MKIRDLFVVVILFPIALNAIPLSGIGKGDPVISYSNLQTDVVAGPGYGLPHIDPSIGTSFVPLGRKSAQELVSGKLPWWDPDEGIGVPLAGEMIAASFYPLTILQLLPDGQTIIDVIVQMLTGVFTLLLLRRLRIDPLASTAAALLFECNGTFAWLDAGWCYPMPLIPLLLYGTELLLGATRRERIFGSVLVTVSIAFSITAAMIEIAYLNGLLCVAWALVRIATRSPIELAKRFGRLSLAALAGLALASPLIVAFVDYIAVSDVGPHSGVNRYSALTEYVIPQTFLPYVFGPIFYAPNPDIANIWGGAGGYAGVALTILAICGLFGRVLRPLRIVLGGWAVLTYAATIGIWFAQFLVTEIPGVRLTAYNRYFDSSREFALAVLVALFLHDVRTGKVEARRYVIATVAFVAIVGQGIFDSPSFVQEAIGSTLLAPWFWGSIAFAIAMICAIWLSFATLRSSRRYAYVLAFLVVGEAAAEAFLPTVSFPTAGRIDEGPVTFLQTHLGLQRFYELGPIAPSFGAYYDIAELDCIGFVARTWENYIVTHLDPYADPKEFNGVSTIATDDPAHDAVLRANLAAFEEVGVRYVVSPANTRPLKAVRGAYKPAQPGAASARLVYHDAMVDIDELPAPVSYFTAEGCRLEAVARERVRARCSAPAVLVRRELFLPGWSARVNGVARAVVPRDVFQTVSLAAGDSDVTFDFLPPGMPYAYATFALALLALGAAVVIATNVKPSP